MSARRRAVGISRCRRELGPAERLARAGGRRDLLVIGTSFSHHLVRLLRAARAVRNVRYVPYYRVSHRSGLALPRDVLGRRLVILEQWQWSYLSVNNSEFVDTLEKEVPGFAELMRNPNPTP